MINLSSFNLNSRTVTHFTLTNSVHAHSNVVFSIVALGFAVTALIVFCCSHYCFDRLVLSLLCHCFVVFLCWVWLINVYLIFLLINVCVENRWYCPKLVELKSILILL